MSTAADASAPVIYRGRGKMDARLSDTKSVGQETVVRGETEMLREASMGWMDGCGGGMALGLE